MFFFSNSNRFFATYFTFSSFFIVFYKNSMNNFPKTYKPGVKTSSSSVNKLFQKVGILSVSIDLNKINNLNIPFPLFKDRLSGTFIQSLILIISLFLSTNTFMCSWSSSLNLILFLLFWRIFSFTNDFFKLKYLLILLFNFF